MPGHGRFGARKADSSKTPEGARRPAVQLCKGPFFSLKITV